jgi:hypothetical protein
MPRVKQPGHADHWPPFSAEIKNEWKYTLLPLHALRQAWKNYTFNMKKYCKGSDLFERWNYLI